MEDILNIDFRLLLESGLESVTFEMFIKFVIIYFFIIWISVIVWVIKDINNRTNNIFLQVISILIILFLTPLSVFIYLLIRPSKTLFEKYYEEIENNLDTVSTVVEESTKRIEESSTCFKCNTLVSKDFKFCPNCKVNLKVDCSKCKKIYYALWEICPYCWIKNTKKAKVIQEGLFIKNYLQEWDIEDNVEKKIKDVLEKKDGG